jgi:hypothetical protein
MVLSEERRRRTASCVRGWPPHPPTQVGVQHIYTQDLYIPVNHPDVHRHMVTMSLTEFQCPILWQVSGNYGHDCDTEHRISGTWPGDERLGVVQQDRYGGHG